MSSAATLPVRLENIVKTHANGQAALRGLSLEIRPGEVVGLLGPNGAGKTTAIKLLATVLKPSGGQPLAGPSGKNSAPASWTCWNSRAWIRQVQCLGTYSNGMQRKVTLAAAILSDFAILLLNEPTVSLDPQGARMVKVGASQQPNCRQFHSHSGNKIFTPITNFFLTLDIKCY